MTKDEVLAALPKLTKPELEVVAAMCGHLLGGHTAAQNLPATGPSQAVFNALVAALGLPMGYQSFSALNAAKHFENRVGTLVLFLNDHFKGWDDHKITQQAFLTELFRLLADDLKNRGVNPSVGVMVINMRRIPEVFDSCFPGYRQSGAGYMIMERFKPKQG